MKLLHFTAEWCGPCKMMKPIIDEIVSEHEELDYIAIDIDENRDTAIDYEIMGVPTFILVGDDENMIVRVTGALPKQKFLDALGI